MNLNQIAFNNSSNTAVRFKRLRHVHLIFAKNLQIPVVKFSVWYTLHTSGTSRAFYISEKKESERSPKWHPLYTSNQQMAVGLACKQLLVRIWYVCEESNGLHLLLELNVNLDSLVCELEPDYSRRENLLVFEIFGKHFAEPLESANASVFCQAKSPVSIQKPSYSLNLMTRLHDFQRVMHETRLKIGKLKKVSLSKFTASSRLRELQLRRDQLLQTNNLYREQLRTASVRTEAIQEFCTRSQLKSALIAHRLSAQRTALDQDQSRLKVLEQSIEVQCNALNSEHKKLVKRQAQMVAELADIFRVERLSGEFVNQPNGHHSKNRLKIIEVNFRSYNKPNAIVKNIEQQNAVVLGYVIHSLIVLSEILATPLRHPVIFRGSKSLVVEQLNSSSSSEYPLFKQNSSSQDPQFAHAVTLLNKNLSQLRLSFDNHKNVDSNDMLGNLKWMFDNF